MHVCMYACLSACLHVCMSGWMYVCMYASPSLSLQCRAEGLTQLRQATQSDTIYAYMLTPTTTRGNAHFARLSITVIRQRGTIAKIQNFKNPKHFTSRESLQLFLDLLILGFWIFGLLDS